MSANFTQDRDLVQSVHLCCFFSFFVEKVVNFEVALNPGKHVNKKKFQKLLKFVGIFLRRKKKTASEHRTRGVKMEGKGRGLEL